MAMTQVRSAAILTAILSVGVGCTQSLPQPEPAPTSPAPADTPAGDAYYLSGCASCGGTLGAKGEAIELLLEGRELRFCTAACRDAFVADPVRGLARIDRVIADDQRNWYPPGPSIVSGRALPAQPVEFVWRNRLFRVADQAERDLVLAAPRDMLRRLDAAVIQAQRGAYGMPDRCPVQGDILPGDTPLDLVVANRMVRVCCPRCARVVRARPSSYLPMVEYAFREAARNAQPR